MGIYTVSLEDVRIFARHGLLPQETKVGNEFRIDLDVCYPAEEKELPADENIEDTISYVDLYDIVRREMDVNRKLLETVAREIARSIKKAYPFVTSVRCKITKLTPPISNFEGHASVTFTL